MIVSTVTFIIITSFRHNNVYVFAYTLILYHIICVLSTEFLLFFGLLLLFCKIYVIINSKFYY